MTIDAENNASTLAENLWASLDDGKAIDIRTLDVRRLTVITDFMLVASGRSSRQVKALTRRVREKANATGATIIGIEGERQAQWVLVDLDYVVVHIMQPEARDFYQLEKLWSAHIPAQADVI